MLRRRTSEQETQVLVIWWCAGIDKNLVLHNLTLTQTKKSIPEELLKQRSERRQQLEAEGFPFATEQDLKDL